MDIYAIRRRQIEKAIRLKFRTQAAFAGAVGRPANYISRMLKGRPPKEGGKRLTGDAAREWEVLAELPQGYFDDPNASPEKSTRRSIDEEIKNLPQEKRATFEALVRGQLELLREPHPLSDTGKFRVHRDADVPRNVPSIGKRHKK